MDESILYPGSHVEVRIPLAIPKGSDREELARDPRRMLSISMSRRERLPDDLHQAMVMWSFHPDFHTICRFYFDWVSVCEHGPAERFSLFDSIKRRLSWRMSFRRLWSWGLSRPTT